ncbi:winged helix DNA-binding domain-containing protein [Nocardioides sp. B-3]|uniref:winged helix DNA-binding domain-containing protein n=1 Tax=Nocardioides sp. B-3 TaxID=2895565 RepID=UPI0021526F8D|nr:winged helix DNA-binding domain-containing protein [Nocardioides sp. B-3]UUZ60006.1 winged helix DNA-binding domain-containing protein [Nocardioides sp. B-3]
MRHVTDTERRARLARRHAIHPEHRVADAVAATRAMTVLHSTEPPTPYLSLQARVDGLTRTDVDRALYDDRSPVKQLAMRRTLFVFPRDLLPAAWGSASARVAAREWKRIAKDVVQGGLTDDGEAWLRAAREAVLARLAGGDELSAKTLRAELPVLAGRIRTGGDAKWAVDAQIAPRVLTQLGADARIVRGRNASHWRVSQPQWTSMATLAGRRSRNRWTRRRATPSSVRRWLLTFGPGTETDIVWWLGATKAVVRRALADLGAVTVSPDSGDTGWLLADDVEPEPAVEPWGALLPALDPTLMGWKQRDFYLDPEHTPYLFDTNGNGGTTAWWNGRVVGCWIRDPDASVRVILREDVGADAVVALEGEAERLTGWLDGEIVNSIYASGQMREAKLP